METEPETTQEAERRERKGFDAFAKRTKKYSGRLYRHIASPEKGEHFGYLLVVFIFEHTAFRYVALLILCATTIHSVLKDEA